MGSINKQEFFDKFDHYCGSRIDICCDIYHDLVNSDPEERLEMLSFAFRNFALRPSDHSYAPASSGISDARVKELGNLYGKMTDKILNTIIQKAIANGSSDVQVYEDIWNLVVNNPVLSTEEERIFGLYNMLIDQQLPYFSIQPGLKMDNEEYDALQDEYADELRKIRFILSVDFDQRTKEASNILDAILAQPDYKVQTLLVSRVISILRDQNRD